MLPLMVHREAIIQLCFSPFFTHTHTHNLNQGFKGLKTLHNKQGFYLK